MVEAAIVRVVATLVGYHDPNTLGHEEAQEMRQVIEGRRTLAGVLAVALLMSGCTTTHLLNVDPSEVQDLRRDEGIVFGSLRVEIAAEGGRLGRRAAGYSYRLTMPGPRPLIDFDVFHEEWELLVSPGEERTFVARLPAGYRDVGELEARPTWTRLGGKFDILASFRVTSGEVTYLGRLVLVLPERLGISSKAHVRVEDGLATAQAALGGDYGERFESPRVELINVTSDQATFVLDLLPIPTVSVP